MPDTGKRRTLEYRVIPKTRRRYVEDAWERKWRYFRIVFRAGLVALVFVFVWHFADDYFVTGQLTALQPADFVPFVEQEGVPIVQACKQYRNGKWFLPETTHALEEAGYLPRDTYPYGFLRGNRLMFVDRGHFVYYDFTPGAEKWEVAGPVADGIIPAPPVPTPPAQPATQP